MADLVTQRIVFAAKALRHPQGKFTVNMREALEVAQSDECDLAASLGFGGGFITRVTHGSGYAQDVARTGLAQDNDFAIAVADRDLHLTAANNKDTASALIFNE